MLSVFALRELWIHLVYMLYVYIYIHHLLMCFTKNVQVNLVTYSAFNRLLHLFEDTAVFSHGNH